MTTLMERAIGEAGALPDSEQDFLAALLLEDIRDSQHWDAQLAASKDVLEELFDEAMEEYQRNSGTGTESAGLLLNESRSDCGLEKSHVSQVFSRLDFHAKVDRHFHCRFP